MTKSTDLATRTANTELANLQYAILEINPAEMGQILRENTGEDTISAFDLDRVKVPAGGSTTWSVPSLDGEEDAKTIEGVIIFQRTTRSFWKQRMEESGGGTAPDCSSTDSVLGTGNPQFGEIAHPDLADGEVRYNQQGEEIVSGHFACSRCPLSAFGSATNGRAQACKQSRQLFMVRESSVLPLLIGIPPSSLRQLKQYMLRLSGAGVPFYGVVTSLALQKQKNTEGIQYAEVVPSVVQRLSPEETARMREVSRHMGPLLASVAAEAEQDLLGETIDDLASKSDAEREAFLAQMRGSV